MGQDELGEREKELDCLYKLADLFLRYHVDEAELLRRVEAELRAAMTYPDDLELSLEIRENSEGERIKSLRCETKDLHFYAAVPLGEKEQLSMRLHALEEGAMPGPRERGLINSVLQMSSGAIQRYRTEAEVMAKNATLSELLRRLQEARSHDERQLRVRLKSRVFPLLNEIEQGAEGLQRQQFELLRGELDKITDFAQASTQCLGSRLTPREIEICNLVGKGVVSKDIAGMLHISRETVERHRCTIRKKLGLNRTGENLTTYLMNL